MPKVFDRNNVILLRIDEADLNSFLIDMDIGDDGASRYMLEEFAKVVMEVIPEYVFANYENDEINNLNAVGKLREAAHSIYKIKEFELMRRYYMNGDLQAKQKLELLYNVYPQCDSWRDAGHGIFRGSDKAVF